MSKVQVSETLLPIMTYLEGEPEKLPIYAENRVHQRTSGAPYPNAVTVNVRNGVKTVKNWKAIILENDYLELTILPELGGRIFSAVDKTTGKDFFYRQHVIKPASIGMLGSWISGGVEFNSPVHHRPSTFMPVDYTIVQNDEETIVWLYENDVFDRILIAVGIALRPDRAFFETRMRIYNRTALSKSFLWWENAAVPASPDYRIFFPQDVGYVYFHYKRNATAYPITGGWFNGHELTANSDISRHGSTTFPTSYFSAASKYDYFGGYDEKAEQGVIHVADHHISPGKKMFTWAYNQLSKTWENALTDTDGPYLELMAGSYSDNQPDFSWIYPYEEKNFSQFWYPFAKLGVPVYANLDMAISVDRQLGIYPTGDFGECRVTVDDAEGRLIDTKCEFKTAELAVISYTRKPVGECFIQITRAEKILVSYRTQKPPKFENVQLIEGYPTPVECKTAEEACLTGTHVMQYRDPGANAARYFERALELSPDSYDACKGLALCKIAHGDLNGAHCDAKKAWELLTIRNKRPHSGEIPYLYGYTCELLGLEDEAESAYWSAYFANDYKIPATLRIAMLEGRRGDFGAALKYSKQAEAAGITAKCLKVLYEIRVKSSKCTKYSDPISNFTRYTEVVSGEMSPAEFIAGLHSNPSQTCIDIYEDLRSDGLDLEADNLLEILAKSGKEYSCMVDYLRGKSSKNRELCRTFPYRECEKNALEAAAEKGDQNAEYLLGCLLLGRREYEAALKYFIKSDEYDSIRNSAVCLWKLGRKDESYRKLELSYKKSRDPQLLWELLHVSNLLGKPDYGEIEPMIADEIKRPLRDDIVTELAAALNRSGSYSDAKKLLESHKYVPCEGGEGAVADVWINANRALADERFAQNDYTGALELYRAAAALPDNLGSGYWNDSKLAPLWYGEGCCLEMLGDTDGAKERYYKITALLTDFFSDMGLPELDIWKIRAHKKLGQKSQAEAIKVSAKERWTFERDRIDSGFFATTPFFDSYDSEADAQAKRRGKFERMLKLLESET